MSIQKMYNPHTLITDTEKQGGLKTVTIAIVLACKDGIVIGADRKVTRNRVTHIKNLETKVIDYRFKNGREILFCYSGNFDFANRVIGRISPEAINVEPSDCEDYRDTIETEVSKLVRQTSDKGLDFDTVLLFATIDTAGNNSPIIGHITQDGTELKNARYFTTGIAASYAEFVLNDAYDGDMKVQDARLLLASLIRRIGEIDNDVEGLDVFAIKTSDPKKIISLTEAERLAIDATPLSLHFMDDLGGLKDEIKSWQDIVEPKNKKRKLKKGEIKTTSKSDSEKSEP